MAYIVNSTISQTATVFNSDESAFHGLKRDEDGLLTYTKMSKCSSCRNDFEPLLKSNGYPFQNYPKGILITSYSQTI